MVEPQAIPACAGRLPLLAPGELTPPQRGVYDEIAGGRRANGPFRVADEDGRLLGPFNALLYSPGVGDAVQRLGQALRFDGAVPSRLRELVICAVAAEWGSQYEWYAHSRVALGTGLTTEQLATIRAGEEPDGLDLAEHAALAMTRALLRTHEVPEPIYRRAAAELGQAGAVEVAILVGYYQLLAGLLATCDVGAPE
jgi:4-carboxymuconolactone decarboxylase